MSPVLYSNRESADPSKCPFFGGSNGGGIGDANLATGLLFVLLVVLMRTLLLRLAANGPRLITLLISFVTQIPRMSLAWRSG